jgi:xanthine dehydrogenase accessory factor
MGSPAASILARAADLAEAGRPFVLATVVAVARPTSAKPGARGIIHPDGTIEGWVGGSCAQPTVVAEAPRAMADGEPRLLRLSAEQPTESRRADGIIDFVMTCHSGGTLEIFIEPQLPAPELWIAGVTPIARSLAELAMTAGWQVTAVDPAASGELFPDGVRLHVARDFAGLDAIGSPFVVVASQGQWDEEALVAAFGRDVAYVGLVASARRAAAVAEYLELAGVPADRRAALRAPCGLDLGAAGAAEVAISVLAELVQVRRGRAPFVAMPGPATLAGAGAMIGLSSLATRPTAGPAVGDHSAAEGASAGEGIILVDPVCGMSVDPANVRHIADHEGRTYAFCCASCRTRFAKNPARYLALA